MIHSVNDVRTLQEIICIELSIFYSSSWSGIVGKESRTYLVHIQFGWFLCLKP